MVVLAYEFFFFYEYITYLWMTDINVTSLFPLRALKAPFQLVALLELFHPRLLLPPLVLLEVLLSYY